MLIDNKRYIFGLSSSNMKDPRIMLEVFDRLQMTYELIRFIQVGKDDYIELPLAQILDIGNFLLPEFNFELELNLLEVDNNLEGKVINSIPFVYEELNYFYLGETKLLNQVGIGWLCRNNDTTTQYLRVFKNHVVRFESKGECVMSKDIIEVESGRSIFPESLKRFDYIGSMHSQYITRHLEVKQIIKLIKLGIFDNTLDLKYLTAMSQDTTQMTPETYGFINL